MLGPVIAAMIFTFLLQGVVNSLQKYGLAKIPAVLTTYLLFLVAFISALIVLVPIVGRQTTLLLKRTSQYGLSVKRIV